MIYKVTTKHTKKITAEITKKLRIRNNIKKSRFRKHIDKKCHDLNHEQNSERTTNKTLYEPRTKLCTKFEQTTNTICKPARSVEDSAAYELRCFCGNYGSWEHEMCEIKKMEKLNERMDARMNEKCMEE